MLAMASVWDLRDILYEKIVKLHSKIEKNVIFYIMMLN